MANSKRSIFRSNAVQHYIEGREKDVLPRFVSPPVFLFLWLVLGLLSMAGFVAWWGRVPTYTTGSGVLTTNRKSYQAVKGQVAVVFLPPDQLPKLRPGQQVGLQVGTAGQYLHQTIETVEPKVLSPTQARQRYSLDGATLLAVTQPSAVAIVNLKDSNLKAATYAGSVVPVKVEVGSTRLTSLLPLLNKVIGD